MQNVLQFGLATKHCSSNIFRKCLIISQETLFSQATVRDAANGQSLVVKQSWDVKPTMFDRPGHKVVPIRCGWRGRSISCWKMVTWLQLDTCSHGQSHRTRFFLFVAVRKFQHDSRRWIGTLLPWWIGSPSTGRRLLDHGQKIKHC